MDAKNTRKELTTLSRAAFSRKFNIPIRTLEAWEAEKRTPPQYVIDLLEKVILMEKEETEIMDKDKF